MIWTIIGMIAATLTSFAFIPQIVKAVKTKSVKDVSLITLVQFAFGSLLWFIYGLYRQDPIIITANLTTLASLIILLSLYYFYRNKK